jgi:hypothetical protein
MSRTTWGIIGVIGCWVTYELLRYKVSTVASLVFVGLVVVAWIVAYLLYRKRLARLHREFSELSPEDREKVVQEIDPEIVTELKKLENQRDGR